MDYYQFFSQLKEMNNNNPNAPQPTSVATQPPPSWWEAPVPSVDNSQGKDLLTLPVNSNNSNNNNSTNNNVNTSNSFISEQFENILESQRMIKELNKKEEKPSEPLPMTTSKVADNNNIALQLQHFMSTVEKKIETLESTVHLLTAEFHNFSQHQGNYNNEFLRALSQLSTDISNAKSTVAQVSTVSTLSKSSSYSISPAYANVDNNMKVQEENDAEIARKLQEEFDKVNSAPKPPVPVVNSLYPVSQANSIYPVSSANNIYSNQLSGSVVSQPQPQPQSPPPSIAQQATATMEKEECPFCQVLFPIKELQSHVENHLNGQGTSSSPAPPPPAGQLATSPPQDQGFFSKLFGKSGTQKAPTTAPPPSQPKPPVIVNRPPGQMVIAPGGGYYSPMPVVPQGSMVYRPYPPQGYPQPQPQPPQIQSQIQPQIVYINPDGTPYKQQ